MRHDIIKVIEPQAIKNDVGFVFVSSVASVWSGGAELCGGGGCVMVGVWVDGVRNDGN